MPETEDTIQFPIPFGIRAATGRPLEGLDAASLKDFAQGSPNEQKEADNLATKDAVSGPHYGAVAEVDPNALDESGWAVMFSPSADQRVREALQPLLDLRKQQVADERLFVTFEGATGYLPGQTASAWLSKRGVSMNIVNPRGGVPFYLLLVGPPDEIPFEFQYGLDIFWAVGRLWFDTADEFRQYADSVVGYESMPAVPSRRHTTIFAPRHDFDEATQFFCKQVATPLAKGTETDMPIGVKLKFGIDPFIAEPATRDALHDILSGKAPLGSPAILLTGSHGVAFAPDDARVLANQGALVCQDWDGYGAITPEQWYAASDVPANASVHGMIHVLFACYGGGCPQFDNFKRAVRPPAAIAPKSFISRLPQALLAHPQGGALASLAHVERAWAYSFQSERRGAQVQGFRDVLTRLMRGDRIGQAVDQFNLRWAALTTELAEVLDDINHNVDVPLEKLASMWVARDDARNYIVLGDPAVRLRVAGMAPAL